MNLSRYPTPLEGLLKHLLWPCPPVSTSGGLPICIPNQFPGDLAGWGPHFEPHGWLEQLMANNTGNIRIRSGTQIPDSSNPMRLPQSYAFNPLVPRCTRSPALLLSPSLRKQTPLFRSKGMITWKGLTAPTTHSSDYRNRCQDLHREGRTLPSVRTAYAPMRPGRAGGATQARMVFKQSVCFRYP